MSVRINALDEKGKYHYTDLEFTIKTNSEAHLQSFIVQINPFLLSLILCIDLMSRSHLPLQKRRHVEAVYQT